MSHSRSLAIAIMFCVATPILEQINAADEKLPEGDNGLAANYPGDMGIEKDRSVILADDFESHADTNAMTKRWDIVSFRGASLSTAKSDVYSGKQSFAVNHPETQS